MGPRLSAYEDALASLYRRTTGVWRLGLERSAAFLRDLGDPQQALRVLHVAGTNGKGSVCATLDTVLRARGHRVARYTSPHLVDFRERLLVDGRPVDAARITAFLARWADRIDQGGVTFFEATTCMALSFFAEDGVDLAVIEVGLGGRLDATNVVDPLVAVVTSIGLDHTEYLGPTLSDIAREKAGIFKRGRPAVIGERDPALVATLRGHAQAAGAAPIAVTADWAALEAVQVDGQGTTGLLGGRRFRTPLLGAHQAQNLATALHALTLLPAPYAVPVEEALPLLASVRLPGRLQRHGAWLFDVAHNPAGAEVLAAALRAGALAGGVAAGAQGAAAASAGPLTCVLGVLGDKDWRGMLAALAPVVQGFVLTTAPTAGERAWDLAAVAAEARAAGYAVRVEPDFEAALSAAAAAGGTTLVTGSFHTVGDAMRVLSISPFAG